MPKIKTHKATAKRFKVTARGKVMRTHVGKSHLRRRKAKRNKRKPRGRPPQPPTPGPRDGDQYNFTDPEEKSHAYQVAGSFMKRFEKQHGAIN